MEKRIWDKTNDTVIALLEKIQKEVKRSPHIDGLPGLITSTAALMKLIHDPAKYM